MDVFMVGGAVRDLIMGKIPKDHDFVVVGSTPEEMIERGFVQVGADFPVFLSENGDEYALARTEYKEGTGYKGFKVSFGTDVTLEDDLFRRDLTINAIAMGNNVPNSPDGEPQYIDPYGGIDDIKNKVLRHVSPAFADDPLRVIRLARFAARYPNFTIDPVTMEFARIVANSINFYTLSPERVGVELMKVISSEGQPSRFFRVLKELNALEFYFPEIHALIGQTQPEKWHPEGDAFEHTMLVLDQARNFGIPVRFAALVHDLGKGLTPKDKLPHHYGHEAAGVKPVGQMVDRLSLGNDMKKYGQYIAKFHMHVHKALVLNPKTYVNVFEETPRDKPMYYVHALIVTSACDARGRGPESEKEDYDQAGFFRRVMGAIDQIKVRNIMTEEEIAASKPEKIKQRLRSARIAAATQIIKEMKE